MAAESKSHSTPRADVLAEEYRGTYLWEQLDKARARIAELEEQLEAANAEIDRLLTRIGTELSPTIERQRGALALADEFVKWIADNYPKAVREMPTTLYVQMQEAGRMADSFPASRPK